MNHSEKKNYIGRRQFVKGTTLASGAMMLGAFPFSVNAIARPNNKKLKLALIGCGGRGTGAAVQALNADPDLELVAMADAFADRLNSSLNNMLASDELPQDRKKNIKVNDNMKFTGFDAYKKAIAEADVVILATPPGFRPYHLEEAVNQDKHIFCEKPLATDAPGIRKVLALVPLVDQKKLNVVVGLQRHYQNNYIAALKRVHDGEIGDVISGQVYWNSGGVWVNEREELLKHYPKLTELEYQMRNWYYFNWLCGDHIVEQHIHNIDVFNWAKNAYPVMAQGMGGREVRKGKDHGEIFDHHYVEYHYEDGAVLNSQCRHIKNCLSNVSETIVGTKGKAELSGDGSATIQDFAGNKLYRHRGKDDPNPYQVEHDKLFAAIRNGEHINDLENGAKSTMTAIMGRYATYSGKAINWDDALNSGKELMPSVMTWDSEPPVKPLENGYYPVAIPGQTEVLAG